MGAEKTKRKRNRWSPLQQCRQALTPVWNNVGESDTRRKGSKNVAGSVQT